MLGWAKFSVLLMQLKFQSLCQKNSREDIVLCSDVKIYFSRVVNNPPPRTFIFMEEKYA